MFSREYPDSPVTCVGGIVIRDDAILLIKRSKPPGEGMWAIPGGRLELGETLQESAEREIMEETGVVVKAKQSVYTFDLIERDENGRIRFHYIIVDLMADYISGEPLAGDDALDASWLTWEEIQKRSISKSTLDLLRVIEFSR